MAFGTLKTPAEWIKTEKYNHVENELSSVVIYDNKVYATKNTPQTGISPDIDNTNWICMGILSGGTSGSVSFSSDSQNMLAKFKETTCSTHNLVNTGIFIVPTFIKEEFGFTEYYVAFIKLPTTTEEGMLGLFANKECTNLIRTTTFKLPDSGMANKVMIFGNISLSITIPTKFTKEPKLYEAFDRINFDHLVDIEYKVNNLNDMFEIDETMKDYEVIFTSFEKTLIFINSTKNEMMDYDILINLDKYPILNMGSKKQFKILLSDNYKYSGANVNIKINTNASRYFQINGIRYASCTMTNTFALIRGDEITIDMFSYQQRADNSHNCLYITRPVYLPKIVPNNDNRIKLYTYNGNTHSVEYDTAVIPKVTSITYKSSFPSKKMVFSVVAIEDSFYDTSKNLVVAMATDTVNGNYNSKAVKLAKDNVTYTHNIYETSAVKTVTVENEYIKFIMDASVLATNANLYNVGQALIVIDAPNSYVNGYCEDLPMVIDNANPNEIQRNKTDILGADILLKNKQTYIKYDGRQINAGNKVLKYNLNLSHSMLDKSYTKYIIFSCKTAIDMDHIIKLNITTTTANLSVPNKYTINGDTSFSYDIPMQAKANKTLNYIVKLSCVESNILLEFDSY